MYVFELLFLLSFQITINFLQLSLIYYNFMIQQSIAKVFCQTCKSNIVATIWQIHQGRCKKYNKKSQLRRKIFQNNKQNNSNLKISKIQGKQQQQQKQYNIQEQKEQMIPCLQCGQIFPFSLYSIHQQECIENQIIQCRDCKIKIQTYLIEQHNKVCEKKKVNQHKFNHYQIDHQHSEQEDFEEMPEMQLHLSRLISNLANNEQKQPKQGLTKLQISQLPQNYLKKDQDCPICYVKMKKFNCHVQLHCKHTFHRNCINPWLLVNPLCPMCRAHTLKK